MQDYYLRFIGAGWLAGIPARDLTRDEIQRRGLQVKDLLASGLWIKEPIQSKHPEENEEVNDAR